MMSHTYDGSAIKGEQLLKTLTDVAKDLKGKVDKVSGAGSESVPIYIDGNGDFKPCGGIPDVAYIQFSFNNETTAQDAVYAAVAGAYAAGKLPVLYCKVTNAVLYWMPIADGFNGYSFSHTTDSYSYKVTIDHTSHIITHATNEIVNYTAGNNINIDGNHQISATDTTYTAGILIDISDDNVISNTMHENTDGLMISYNTLSNAGVTTYSFGPWRIQVTKKAMATWDTSDASLLIQFAHADYLDGSIHHGKILVDDYNPWADGLIDTVYNSHAQWGFNGSYSQGGNNLGFPIGLKNPIDDDGVARACPKRMVGYKFTINCGINRPDWLECEANALYVNNNTSINTNAARLLLRVKYFYA